MNRGFTLIELMVVVIIIGILSAVALPQYEKTVEHSRATEALTLMSALSDSVQRYYDQKEVWPANNTFTALDIDIPSNAGCDPKFGGKNFCLSTSSSGTNYTISAKRMRNSKLLYTLKTVVTANDAGYTVTRSCVYSDASDTTKGKSYCDIITGSKNTNF